MRVRIENDSLPGVCTRVTDAETGQLIDGVPRPRRWWKLGLR